MTQITLNAYRGSHDAAPVRELLHENVAAARDLAILDWCRFITQANAETLPSLHLLGRARIGDWGGRADWLPPTAPAAWIWHGIAV